MAARNTVRREVWAVKDREASTPAATVRRQVVKVAVRRPNGTFLGATNYRQQGVR